MVKVAFVMGTATVSDGQWTSDDADLTALLVSLTPLYGVSGAAPDRDRALATNAIDLLGGKILEADDLESDEGVIY